MVTTNHNVDDLAEDARGEQLDDPYTEALARLATLPNDWDSHGAAPPNTIAIANARRLLIELQTCQTPKLSVLPSVEEGIGIFSRNGEKYMYIECLNSGEIVVGFSDSAGQREVEEISADQVSLRVAATKMFNSSRA
jgi:hypothetical protein